MSTSNYHESVLLHECVQTLVTNPDGVYVDATFGGGGHSKAILEKLSPKGKLIAFDQDKDAWNNVINDKRFMLIPENFRYIKRFLRLYNFLPIDGILADLGVSSFQFDEASRGFSIRFDAPLDMRMDNRTQFTAKDILNTYSEKQLHKLFEKYGEVTNARTLANTIVQQRKQSSFETIDAFKKSIASCIKANENKYLAQVFQALRIEVNKELEVLKQFMNEAIDCLKPDGRLCVITFHSLEDRIVKQAIRGELNIENENQNFNPYFQNTKSKELKPLYSKPITPSPEELKRNTRSRSAKLRVAVKQ